MKRYLPLGVLTLRWSPSLNESGASKEKKSQCDQYNSLLYKFRGNERSNSCEKEKGCTFVGVGWNGMCSTKKAAKSAAVDPDNIVYSLLLSQETNTPAVSIEILMKKTLTSSVADSIVEAHDAAHQVSKELVIEVLDDPDNVAKLAIALGNIFSNEAVLRPVRDFSYFHLHTQGTMQNIIWLLHEQMKYFFKENGKVCLAPSNIPEPQLLL